MQNDQLIKRRLKVKQLMILSMQSGYYQKAMQAQSIIYAIDKRISQSNESNLITRQSLLA